MLSICLFMLSKGTRLPMFSSEELSASVLMILSPVVSLASYVGSLSLMLVDPNIFMYTCTLLYSLAVICSLVSSRSCLCTPACLSLYFSELNIDSRLFSWTEARCRAI